MGGVKLLHIDYLWLKISIIKFAKKWKALWSLDTWEKGSDCDSLMMRRGGNKIPNIDLFQFFPFWIPAAKYINYPSLPSPSLVTNLT